MPGASSGRSPRKIAAAKAKAEKIFNDSANTRAAEIGVTLPANFQELSNNQSQKSSGISKYTGADYVNLYTSNKTAFLENAVKNATYDYAWLSYGRTTSPENAELRLKNAVTAAAQNGVSIPSIYSSVEAGKNDWGSYIGSRETNIDKIAGYAAPIAMAYLMPQMGASLGTALLQAGVVTTASYASAVGTALTSIAIQTAQGASFDDALKNATVNAIISTGAPSVATEINDIVKNPAVSDAIVSAGASAIRTAAAGGSTEDMQKNILGAIAGSATTSATGDNIAGSTVGGAVTGGVAGALSGAASALGTDAARDTSTTTGTSADPGIQVAGGDDATALNMASISAMPEMLGKAGETASPITAKTEEGVTFYERTITGTTPDGKPYSYIATYDPTAPVGKQVDYVTGSGTTVTATAVRPNFSTTDTTTSGGYTPTITTTPLNVVNTSGTSTTGGTDKAILDLISGTTTGGGPTTDANYPSFVSSDTAGSARANILLDEIRSSIAGTGAGSDQAAIDAQNTGSTAVDTGVGVVTTPVTDTTATDAAATKKGILDAKTKSWTAFAKLIGDSLSNPITTTKVNTTPSTTEMSTTKTKIADAKAKVDAALLGLSKPVTNITSVGTDTTTGATTNTGTTTSTGASVGTGAGTGTTAGLPDTTGTTTTTVGTNTGAGAGAGTGTGTDKAILDLISTDTGIGTDASTGAITDAATDTTDTTTEEPTPVDAGEEELPPEEVETEATTPTDKYKPKLFIYGGTTPSTLSQSLGTGDTYSKSVATTGLTGSRGAGEIESKETGKKRRTVWNEESLRLKDALGL